MLEKLTETLTKLQDNPMEAFKWLVEEEKKLKNTILSNRPSTLLLIKYLEEKYKKEDLSAISENLQDFIEQKMKPSLTDRLLSDIQDPLDEIQKTFWSWESEIETLINEYADLFHKQPCDQKEVDTRLETHGIWTTKVIQLSASKDSSSDSNKTDVETPTVEEKTDVLAPDVQQIIKDVKIEKSFANIKEIKHDGKIILAATWESPYINKDALPDLIWFALAFYKKTWDALTINSCYRDLDHQEELHEKYKKWKWNLAAEPWKSGHNLWLSVDIHAGDRYSKELWWIEWLRDMAKQYNFSPIDSEDRHFDHKLFVDMKSNKEDRLALARKLNEEYKAVA